MSENDIVQIHRYVDGDMTRAEVLTFEAQMEKDPALAAQIAEIMAQDDALRAAIPSRSESELNALLQKAEAAHASRMVWPGWRQMAAAVVLVTVGFGAGLSYEALGRTGEMPMSERMLRTASAAHELYAVEVVHPVEVPASERDHLKGWLSNRLGAEVSIPDLRGRDLTLVGGRLLPFEQGAAAQFMYEDGEGSRVTLYLTPTHEQGNSALRYGAHDGLQAVYWQGGAWRYALVGPFDKDHMTGIAQSVQGALF